MSDAISWSDWLDFSEEQIAKVPESPGVYMMHAAMKILFIGNSANLKQSITESLKAPCTSDAKRFRYFVTDSHLEIGQKLLKEYQEKHDGNLPKCM
jgi:excinuclease UvrABC nuclease subunit